MTDLQLLSVIFTERQAAAILEKCGPRGLAAFSSIDDQGGPRGLLNLPGVDEATAARLVVFFELACRVG